MQKHLQVKVNEKEDQMDAQTYETFPHIVFELLPIVDFCWVEHAYVTTRLHKQSESSREQITLK
jgi:hypothetical protein